MGEQKLLALKILSEFWGRQELEVLEEKVFRWLSKLILLISLEIYECAHIP